MTLYLIPLIWIASNLHLIPIDPLSSIMGAMTGLLILSLTAKIAFYFTKQESLGQGDIDLLAFIGAFLGVSGCWNTLLFGSIFGSVFGIGCILIYGKDKTNSLLLPFGTFLSFGALLTIIQNFTPTLISIF